MGRYKSGKHRRFHKLDLRWRHFKKIIFQALPNRVGDSALHTKFSFWRDTVLSKMAQTNKRLHESISHSLLKDLKDLDLPDQTEILISLVFEKTAPMPIAITLPSPQSPPGGGGGYSWEFLVGVCRLGPQILTLSQTKKCNFPNPFQTKPLKSIPVFRPGLYAEIMLLLLRLERKQISNSHVSLSLTHLELKRQIRSYTPIVP